MNILSATATASLQARAAPPSTDLPVAGKRLTAPAALGGASTTRYADANICYAAKVVSSSGNSAGSMNLETGIWSGNPNFYGSGVDFTGAALPVAATLYALRLTTPADNAAPVRVSAFSGDDLLSLPLLPGASYVLAFPATGRPLAGGGVMSVAFTPAGDSVVVEVLAGTA